MSSFEFAKSKIISSALGKALGMTASTTLATVVDKVANVVNRGKLDWSDNNTTYGVQSGWYSGGTLDSRPSYNAGYSTGYGAGVAAGQAGSNIGGKLSRSGNNVAPSARAAVTLGTFVVPSGKTLMILALAANNKRGNAVGNVTVSGVKSTYASNILSSPDVTKIAPNAGPAKAGGSKLLSGVYAVTAGSTITISADSGSSDYVCILQYQAWFL